jgi:Fe-S-cluster containining protein
VPAPKRPDCRTCGVCCMALHDQLAFCDVDERDLKRLDPKWVRKNVMFPSRFDTLVNAIDGGRLPLGAIRTEWKKQRGGPFKGVEACVCVALRGSLMHGAKCSIYPRRPKACREAVKPGDEACLQVRKLFTEARL